MSNRTLIYLTGLVIVGMMVLLAINMGSILTGQPKTEGYLRYNHVRGVAISHNQILYTLNFNQQNRVVEILNRAVKVAGVKPSNGEKPDFDKLIIYQFDQKADLQITPIAYVDNNLVFSVPEWESGGYLMELSAGDLRRLLSTTYDQTSN